MKRDFVNIVKSVSTDVRRTILTPYDLSNIDYWIFEARGWKFKDILREIEIRSTQRRIDVIINTQTIGAADFIVEESRGAIRVKFIKSKFAYDLDELDHIEIIGDIEPYA
jgi:hypothetical protein